MKQISQNKRSGELGIVSVPPPAMRQGMILVKNYFSVISAGTEKSTIDKRKSSLLERARSQPDDLKKVLDEVRRTGLLTTYKRVMSKLDTLAPLGYSSAGVILAVDESVQDMEVGQRVACAGAEYAFHSDIILVPRNLVVRIPEGVSMETAAYSTIAAIAMQGVRQAEPTLGEIVVVLGLGLLGQFTVQFLKANGCRVIGIDIDPFAIELGRRSRCDLSLHRHSDTVERAVESFTEGHGVDAVIITAGTRDNDPIELSGKITRDRGRVVVVGDASMNIPRTDFYRKEIDIRLSRSYGPGRYDQEYEERGLDYPIGYVRWTENRNMRAFLELALQKKVDTSILTTHRFPIDEAVKAYELIEGEKTEPYVGILLSYEDIQERDLAALVAPPAAQQDIVISPRRSSLTIGFIGAGSFASSHLLPHLQAMEDVTLSTVCNKSGLTGMDMQNKFQFLHSTTSVDEIFSDEEIGTVFIATRHGEHARYTMQAVRNGQHVFVEKPLALNEEELSSIEALLHRNPEARSRILLMVGYNRRFAPLVIQMKEFFQSGLEPSLIHYHVNAGFLPKDHWTHDPIEGGGRIIGEVCHFIDTIQFLTDAMPERIFAECISSHNAIVTNYDNVHITMRMTDGSSASITYASNGDSSLPKERIVMSRANATAVMNNFTSLQLTRGGKTVTRKSAGDKGHAAEVRSFLTAIKEKRSDLIPLQSLFATSRATFRILESLNLKEAVAL